MMQELVQSNFSSTLEVYETQGSPLMGFTALSIKIYNSTQEQVLNYLSPLIEVYEKQGSPAHSYGVINPIYKNLKLHVGTGTKLYESINQNI